MNVENWLLKVKKDQNLFFNIISDMKITAPGPEVSCSVCSEYHPYYKKKRGKIAEKIIKDLQEKFQIALDDNDYEEIYSILGEVWYGVPESKDRWSIQGFKELVDLLDDPPETED